eukprot:707325-Pleurochrysis_carterae.AAC.3
MQHRKRDSSLEVFVLKYHHYRCRPATVQFQSAKIGLKRNEETRCHCMHRCALTLLLERLRHQTTRQQHSTASAKLIRVSASRESIPHSDQCLLNQCQGSTTRSLPQEFFRHSYVTLFIRPFSNVFDIVLRFTASSLADDL